MRVSILLQITGDDGAIGPAEEVTAFEKSNRAPGRRRPLDRRRQSDAGSRPGPDGFGSGNNLVAATSQLPSLWRTTSQQGKLPARVPYSLWRC